MSRPTCEKTLENLWVPNINVVFLHRGVPLHLSLSGHQGLYPATLPTDFQAQGFPDTMLRAHRPYCRILHCRLLIDWPLLPAS
jgi:hypothetical protein